jgi:hypothetical protein
MSIPDLHGVAPGPLSGGDLDERYLKAFRDPPCVPLRLTPQSAVYGTVPFAAIPLAEARAREDLARSEGRREILEIVVCNRPPQGSSSGGNRPGRPPVLQRDADALQRLRVKNPGKSCEELFEDELRRGAHGKPVEKRQARSRCADAARELERREQKM